MWCFKADRTSTNSTCSFPAWQVGLPPATPPPAPAPLCFLPLPVLLPSLPLPLPPLLLLLFLLPLLQLASSSCILVVIPTALAWQVWHKPLPGGAAAVLLVNNAGSPSDVSVELSLLNLACLGTGCVARDIWAHTDLGPVKGAFTAKGLGPHASAFIVVNGSTAAAARA